jgi:glycosyltransferase involved in cell wall biosynthesis
MLKDNPKHIVIVGPAHPLRGGLASFNERLARAFQQQGHTVEIVTFSLQYPGFLFPGTTQYSSEPAPTDLSIKVKINAVNPLNWISTGNYLKRLNADIIIVRYWLPFMGPCLGTILRKARKNGKSRIVCIADNIQPHEKRPGDKAFTKYFIKPVDAFVTMSKKVLADLRLFTADKPASYIPHPLYDNFGEIISADEARKHLGIALTDKVVLFFGFIRQYKGLDLLLEAIALVRKSAPETSGIKFLIAGEFYENRQPYDELIRKLGIEESLILKTDFIPDSEVKYYLCAADLVVQPYRNATQSGVTPLAYHFEVPMLVTNVGGLASMVPDGKAGLHAAPNPASIAEKIIEYFKSGKEHFLPGLKEEKKKYSWDNMVNGILELADDKS